MENIKTYNNHNVRIKFGRASEEQLRNCLNGFLKLLSKKFPGKNYDKCQIDMNVVYTTDRVTGQVKSTGSAFLWVENPEVYYIMCGFNPDGTDRYESVRNSPLQNDTSLKFLEMSFLEILDYDKSTGPEAEIRRELPPIQEIPCFMRKDEDAEEAYQYALREYIRECENQGIEPTPDHEHLRADAKIGHINASRAVTHILQDDKQVQNILRGVVADWVTDDELRRKFGKFDSTGRMKVFTGKKFTETEKKEVIIEYCQKTDGSFALQMNRRTYFTNPKTKETETFIFDFFKNFNKNVSATDRFREDKKTEKPKDKSFLNRNTDTGFATRSQASTPVSSNDGFQVAARRRR